MDEILKAFTDYFLNFSVDQILDSLKKNSFNLEDTYLQLSNPKDFESNF